MGSLFIRTDYKGGHPLSYLPETPMPPDPMIGFSPRPRKPSSWPSVRCVHGKGLTTYWTIPYPRQGQVVARIKYGGYRNKTQSTVDSGGYVFLQWLAQQNFSVVPNRVTTWRVPTCPYWSFSSPREFSLTVTSPVTNSFLQICPDQLGHIWHE